MAYDPGRGAKSPKIPTLYKILYPVKGREAKNPYPVKWHVLYRPYKGVPPPGFKLRPSSNTFKWCYLF